MHNNPGDYGIEQAGLDLVIENTLAAVEKSARIIMDMLSIKVEPGDSPTWEEGSDGRIIQEGHTTFSKDTVMSSYVEESCEDGDKMEESSHPLHNTGIEKDTVQVPVCMEEDEYLRKKIENTTAVFITKEDSDLEDEGRDESSILQQNSHQIKFSITHPMYLAGKSRNNTRPRASFSGSIVGDDPCIQVDSSQQFECLTNGRQRNNVYQVSSEDNIQGAGEHPVYLAATSRDNTRPCSSSSELIVDNDPCIQLDRSQQLVGLTSGGQKNSVSEVSSEDNIQGANERPMNLAATSRDNTRPCASSLELIVDNDPCIQLDSSQQLEGLTSGGHKNSVSVLSSEDNMQGANECPMNLAATSRDNTRPCASSLELIVDNDPCIQLDSSQQLEGLTSGGHKNSVSVLSSEDNMQGANELADNIREYQWQFSENCDEKLVIPENICTHKKSCKCEFCKNSFSSKTACDQHQLIDSGKQFKCQFNGKAPSNCQNHREHKSAHKCDKPAKSKFRKKTFGKKQHCKTHSMTHTGDKPFTCQFREKSSVKKRNYKVLKLRHTGGKMFKCQYCDKSFVQKGACETHEMIHTGEKPFKCQFCEKSFRHKHTYEGHRMTHTGEKPFKCQYCEKSFIHKHERKTHEKIHTGENHFNCQFCTKSFIRRQDCKKHEMTHTGEKPFKCQYCEKKFSVKKNCKTHEMTHTRDRPFTCQFCEKTFGRKHTFEAHRRIHTGEKPFKCQYCEKCFVQKNECKTHEKLHTGENYFNCQFCPKSYIRKQDFKKHEMTHTGEKPFECQYCEKKFSVKHTLKVHERTHTGDKPFACRFCEKTFSVKGHCKTHERTHTGEKPFMCWFCGKSFSRKQYCTRHEMTHTGEKPFKCQYCDKAFYEKRSCQTHVIMTHTGEKPFKCQFCEKSFVRKQYCKTHEMIHTGEKPFKCQFCEKTFSVKRRCKTHEMIHTGEKPFKCQFCERSFRVRGRCKTHELTHTDETTFM